MKVKSSIRKRSPKCILVKRKGKLYIISPDRKHKQRQG